MAEPIGVVAALVLLFFLGTILEAAPEERGAILGNLPVPVRLVWRVLGHPGTPGGFAGSGPSRAGLRRPEIG